MSPGIRTAVAPPGPGNLLPPWPLRLPSREVVSGPFLSPVLGRKEEGLVLCPTPGPGKPAPMSIAAPKPESALAFRTEYRYGDRLLTVSRGSPLPPGACLMPNGVNFALVCRHGTAVWLVLSEPCEGEVYAEIPLDDALQPDRRPLACPGRRPAGGVLLRLPGRRAQGQRAPVRSRQDPARSLFPGTLLRPALGDQRRPAPAQPDERVDDRARRRGQSAGSRSKIRSSTSCTFAATPSIRPRACATPAPSRAGREDRLPEVAGDHGRRAAAGRRVRRERLPVRQSADR